MDYKKILLFTVILVIASAICISPGFATTKTTDKIYFDTKTDGSLVSKKIGSGPYDKVELRYNTVFPGPSSKKIQTHIITGQFADGPTKYKLLSAKVTFIKKVGSKNYYSTKTLKPKNGEISYNAKNGYKPYYAKVTYQKP